MGAGASKIGKESLYDLLGVDPDADKAELKQAYRRKALELHPDRNYQQEEEVTALFAKVQAAYDLLSNVDERHWYDQHRLSATTKYELYDGNFTPASVVRSVTDDLIRSTDASSKLDYGLIQGYFDKLKHEEQEAAFELNLDTPNVVLAAQFGLSSDPWSRVKHFYDVWQDFRTIKSFVWEYIYPAPTQQHNKQTRKKFEQENRKVRDAAKREFEAAVRRAVQLLKQRDPRKPPQKEIKDNNGNAKSKTKVAQATKLLDSGDDSSIKASPPTEALGELNVEKKKTGKAKAKAQRKKQGLNHILTCGTCGEEFPGPEFMEHKRITRHP